MATATKTTGTKRGIDLTKVAGDNPAKTIEQRYHELMSVKDPGQLAEMARELVRHTGGISPTNLQKFLWNLDRALEKGLREVQKFLTNFMLAGAGLGVAKYEAGRGR